MELIKNNKMNNAELLNTYYIMQNLYLADIDMSGSLYIEYEKFNK